MKTLSNREIVTAAITKAGHPLTAQAIFGACDCFIDVKDAAALLSQMVRAKEIHSARLEGEPWLRFGTEGMRFAKVVAAPSVPEPETEPLVTPMMQALRAKHAGQMPGDAPARAPDKRSLATRAAILKTLADATQPLQSPAIGKKIKRSQVCCARNLRILEAEGVVVSFGGANTTRYALTGGAVARAEEESIAARVAQRSAAPPVHVAYDTGRRIVEAIEAAGMPLARPLLAESLGVSLSHVSANMLALIEAGTVVRLGKRTHCVFGLPGMAAPARVVRVPVGRRGKVGRAPINGGGRAAVEAALTSIAAPGELVTSAQIRGVTGLSHTFVGRILSDMVREGALERRGTSMNTAYARAGQFIPAGQTMPARLKIESTFGVDPPAGGEPIIRQQLRGVATIPTLDIDAIHTRQLAGLTNGAASEISQTFNLLRQHLTEDEFKGYLRGNLITLSLRGQPEDLARLQVFGQALAGVV